MGQHLVDSVQEVVPQGVHPLVATLAELDEVVHEDVGVAHRSIEGLVGRRRHFFGLVRQSIDSRKDCQGSVSFEVRWFARSWSCGRVEVVLRLSRRSEPVGSRAQWVSLEVRVGHVTDRFGHRTEGRRRLNPPHNNSQRDYYELNLSFIAGKDEG